MSCKVCANVLTFPKGVKKVAFFAAHEYMLSKIKNIFSNSYNIQDNEEYLLFEADFEKFIFEVSKSEYFNEIEKQNINIILVDLGKEISFRDFNNAHSLDYYINLYYGSDLFWILQNESILTFFQPIVETESLEIFGYECLSRGLKSDGTLMPPGEMFEFAKKTKSIFNLDRQCRIQALKSAFEKNINKNVFINFNPTSIYVPEVCLRDTFAYANKIGFDRKKIVFEVVETERVNEVKHLKSILNYYRSAGFKVALDDVGSGYSSLNLVAQLKPDLIKIDMEIVRNIDKENIKQVIVSSLVKISNEIGAVTLAEGIETKEEFETVKSLGVKLAQGYLFGKPSPEPVNIINL